MPVQFCQLQLYRYLREEDDCIVSASVGILIIGIMLCDSFPRAAESSQFLWPKVKLYLRVREKKLILQSM